MRTVIDGKVYHSAEDIKREAQWEEIRAMLANNPEQRKKFLLSARSLFTIAKISFGGIERKVRYDERVFSATLSQFSSDSIYKQADERIGCFDGPLQTAHKRRNILKLHLTDVWILEYFVVFRKDSDAKTIFYAEKECT